VLDTKASFSPPIYPGLTLFNLFYSEAHFKWAFFIKNPKNGFNMCAQYDFKLLILMHIKSNCDC